MTTQQETAKKVQKELGERSREIWLAGLGLLYTAEEEGSKLFKEFLEKGKKLVEKGEELEKKAKEAGSERKSEISKKIDETIKFFEDKIQGALDTVGITSRSEVKDLSEKVDKLTEKVAMLAEKLEKAEKTPPRPRA